MKRYPSWGRLLLCVVAIVVGCCARSVILHAQVELEARLGFENRVTPGHYAPIAVEIHGLADSAANRLVIVQKVGNAWRGEATMEQDLGYAVQSDGLYESAIPIYDPVNPIVVECRSPAGTVLASATLDLRSTYRTAPYLVLDRRLPRFDEDAALVDVLHLPQRWWALDSARSVWIASPLTSEGWKAITQWVVGGGSLVLITGTDFYRMDSPSLRWLLPISDPELTTSGDGPSYLAGTLTDATILQRSEEGYPLLVETTRGAGHVLLVTVSAQALNVDSMRDIASHVASAGLISLSDTAESILGEEPVSTLNALHVVVLLALVASITVAATQVGRRHRGLGWAILGASTVVLSVLSALVANPDKAVSTVTSLDIALHLDISVPLDIDYRSLYLQTSGTIALSHGEGMIPIEPLPRSLIGGISYDLTTYPTHTDMTVHPGEIRSWVACGAASSLVDMETVSSSEIRVGQYYPFGFDAAWIIKDGTAYTLFGIPQGVHEYTLDAQSAVRWDLLAGTASTSGASANSMILRALQAALPFQNGDWLIAISDRSHIEHVQGVRKVRDMTVVVVAASGGDDGEI